MFATLRCENDTLLTTRADSTHASLACNICRSKKLKCTREKGGCHRCLSRNIECDYPQAARRKTSKRNSPTSSISRAEKSAGTASSPSIAFEGTLTNHGKVTRRPISSTIPSFPMPSWRQESERAFQDKSLELINPQDATDIALQRSFEELNAEFSTGGSGFFPLDPRLLSETDFFWDSNNFDPTAKAHDGTSNPSSFAAVNEIEALSDSFPFSEDSVSSSATTVSLSPGRSLDFSSRVRFTEESPPQLSDLRPGSKEPAGSKASSKAVINQSGTSLIDQVKKCLINPPCHCAPLALGLLEDILKSDVLSTLRTIPTDLQLVKSILIQGRRLTDCPSCRLASNFLTILIMLADKLCFSCEHIIDKLIQRYNEINPDHPYPQKGEHITQEFLDTGRIAGDPEGVNRMLLRDYEVDVEEEPCVFGGLAAMQLRLLKSFLGKLRSIAKTFNWDAHILMIDGVERRVMKELRICGSCGTYDSVPEVQR